MTRTNRAGVRVGALGILLSLCLIPQAVAQDDELRELREQNQEQQRQIEELQRQMKALASGNNLADEVAEQVSEELRGQILDLAFDEIESQAIAAALDEGGLPKWLDGLVFKGDIRIRYEGTWFEDDATYPEDRNRGRFRLRFGFDKTWGSDEDWLASFRLASGGPSPTGAVQTFEDFFSKKPHWIDRAYVRWAPQEGVLKGLELIGGKMPQPFLTTWTHFDTDVSPEGFFEKFTAPWFGDFKPYANFGQLLLTEYSKVPDDMVLLVYGGGFDWDNVINTEDFTLNGGFAANFYDYTDVKDNFPPSPSGNVVTTLPDGRTILAAEDFDIMDFVWYLKGVAWGVDYRVYGNFGVNVGVDEDAPANRGAPYDDNWNVGLKLGRGKKKGDITLEGSLFRVEANSIFGFLGDADTGKADHQGGVIRSFYNINDFTQIGGSLLFVDKISERDESIDHFDALLLDLAIKF